MALDVEGTTGSLGSSAQIGAIATVGEATVYVTERQLSDQTGRSSSTILGTRSPIGDKTQVATTMLGAKYSDALLWVVFGTTIGLLLANVPVVLIGKLSADRMPLGLIRKITAALFFGLAVAAAFGM